MSVWSPDHYRGGHTLGDVNTNLFVHSLPPLHAHTHAHTHTYIHAHTHTHTHTCTHTHTHTHTRAHAQYTHIHTCTHNIPTYTRARTHEQYNTQWGGTALYIAVREECEDIVDLLLEANADPDMPVKVIHTYHTQ